MGGKGRGGAHVVDIAARDGRVLEEIHRHKLDLLLPNRLGVLLPPELSRTSQHLCQTNNGRGSGADARTSRACSTTCGRSCRTTLSWGNARRRSSAAWPLPPPKSQNVVPAGTSFQG